MLPLLVSFQGNKKPNGLGELRECPEFFRARPCSGGSSHCLTELSQGRLRDGFKTVLLGVHRSLVILGIYMCVYPLFRCFPPSDVSQERQSCGPVYAGTHKCLQNERSYLAASVFPRYTSTEWGVSKVCFLTSLTRGTGRRFVKM